MVFFADEPVDVGLKLYPDILATVGGEGEDEGGEAAKAQHESENRVFLICLSILFLLAHISPFSRQAP